MPSAPDPGIDLFLDYNGVLNTNGLSGLCDFMTALDHMEARNGKHDVAVRITLLSYHRTLRGCRRTLMELAEAGVLDLFHKIVFTEYRTVSEGGSFYNTVLEEHTYEPTEDRFQINTWNWEEQTYYWFRSAKDAYINLYGKGYIIFVDDKTRNLRAVQRVLPNAQCIEMPRNATNLQQLYQVIRREYDRLCCPLVLN